MNLFLKILTAPIGRYIRRDNSTKCATRTDGARLCLEMDAAKDPINYFWIGMPGVGRKQEVIYETLPAFCAKCKLQGHNVRTCRLKVQNNGEKVWVRKDVKDMDSGKIEKVLGPKDIDKGKGVMVVSGNIEGNTMETKNPQIEEPEDHVLIPNEDGLKEGQSVPIQDSEMGSINVDKQSEEQMAKERGYEVEEVEDDLLDNRWNKMR